MADATETITQGTLRTTDGRLLPLEATEVEGTVAGPVADVVVRQRFRNTGADPIEAVYLFPLPHEASVYRMHFRIQDRIVRAVVKEKAEARRVYERARSEGRAATLLEEDRPSLFSLSVANIAPGAVIDVELAYQEVVAFDDGHFRFVFPMVAPERYRDSAPAEAPGTLAPPRLPTRERPPDVALSVVVRSASAGFPGAEAQIETLRCVSHRSETERLADGGVRVRLPSGAPIPNRDFVLTWQASGSGVRPRVCFERKAGETGTFLLLVTPSEPRDDGRGMAQDVMRALRCGNCGGTVTDMTAIKDIPGVGPVLPCKYCGAILAPGTEPVTRALQPRDVVILVDRSASMRSSFAQARRAALAVMSGLPLGDGVQLFAFDHDREPFHGDGTSFLALSPEVIDQADRFLSALGPRGGTELEEALLHAGKIPRREGRTRAVVLVTDATVGNEGRLLRRVPELLGASARLYVLGVGSAVDRRLIERLARAGGGAHDVILPDEDVEVTITRFARRVREGGPIVRDLGVFWEGAGMMFPHPSPVPDLFGGQPLRILGRFDGVGPTRLVITGRTVNEKAYRQEIDVDLPAQTSEVPGLARLWARRHVEALAAKAAAEPHRRDLQQEALSLSLEHAIVGPYTSLVAEDSERSVDPGTPAKRTSVPMAKTAEETAEYEAAAGAVAGAVDDDAAAPAMRGLTRGEGFAELVSNDEDVAADMKELCEAAPEPEAALFDLGAAAAPRAARACGVVFRGDASSRAVLFRTDGRARGDASSRGEGRPGGALSRRGRRPGGRQSERGWSPGQGALVLRRRWARRGRRGEGERRGEERCSVVFEADRGGRSSPAARAALAVCVTTPLAAAPAAAAAREGRRTRRARRLRALLGGRDAYRDRAHSRPARPGVPGGRDRLHGPLHRRGPAAPDLDDRGAHGLSALQEPARGRGLVPRSPA